MGRDMHYDKRIAGRAAAKTGTALASEPQHLTVFDPGRYRDIEPFLGRERHPLLAAGRRRDEIDGQREMPVGAARPEPRSGLAQALGTRHTQGAVIARVEPGSPAERAGLRTNDLVVAINGAPMRSGTELRNRVGLSRIGDEVELTVERGGTERSVTVRVERATTTAQRQRPSQSQRQR